MGINFVLWALNNAYSMDQHKAIHVYERAIFKSVTTFQPPEGQFAAGRDHCLMVLDL
jgi:hypothetical protein